MNIYTYTRPEVYLKDMLNEKKRKNPQFSMRAWARMLGMKTHTPLQLMLASKRPIPKKYIPFFGKSLMLTDQEIEYLRAMIDYQRAKKIELKKEAFDRMESLRRKNALDTTSSPVDYSESSNSHSVPSLTEVHSSKNSLSTNTKGTNSDNESHPLS